MRMWIHALTFVLACCGGKACASGAGPFGPPGDIVLEALALPGDSLIPVVPERHVSRALAAALAVTLGPFGAHRIYLGTPPKIPVLYSLTFGGFGVLVLIDLGHILFTRDLSPFLESDKVLMWAEPRGKTATPP